MSTALPVSTRIFKKTIPSTSSAITKASSWESHDFSFLYRIFAGDVGGISINFSRCDRLHRSEEVEID
ncbi:hypothetical protein Bca52824_080318 [Brassica carinata]|uniref:Uncharacterized protein n=1 Tax=Brassica carinata TaxID=52824 RepID=A0A8X7PGE1_BRACI|nr:hypothetical protein Bca52824_080318 [Brassica carinata]